MAHYDRYGILNINQHGFRKRHSCEKQLVNTIEQLAKGLDQKQDIDCLILDFLKAFGTVPHRRLLMKAEYYGINGNILRWIENCLTQRTQTVVVDGYKSDSEPVLSGIYMMPLYMLCIIL